MMGKWKRLLISQKKVIGNFSWSFIASIISTGVMQLCVYPILARIYDAQEYGNILFFMGIFNVVILTTGNALGDIRLTQNTEYEKRGICGDFNLLLMLFMFVSVVVTFFVCELFAKQSIIQTSLSSITLSLAAALGTLHSYLVSLYRLRLQFKDSVYTNLIMSAGYIIGLFGVYVTGIWAFPFLMAYASSSGYMIWRTRFFSEGFQKTSRFKETASEFSILSSSYLIKSGMNYVDRFLITPMIGSAALSVYTIAAVFGKTASIAIQPMANVALGYYSQKDFAMTRKKYWVTNGLTFAFGFVVYCIALLLSKPFIAIMYPEYLEAAAEYIVLANISAILTAVTAMIQPAVLKYCKMFWQVLIQIAYGLTATVLSVLLIKSYSLTGFCYALIIANVFKTVLMLVIGDRNIRKQTC